MTLKVHDSPQFNVSMNLNISYELEYIEMTVAVWNKVAHTTQTKRFEAGNFSAALAYYRTQEAFLFGSEEEKG